MESTLLLAQFWGWLFLLIGAVYLFKKDSYFQSIFELSKDDGFMMLSGYLALVLGLATVILHNVWTLDGRVILTIFGWLSLIKGIVRIGFPDASRRMIASVAKHFFLLRIALGILVVLGALLVLVGS